MIIDYDALVELLRSSGLPDQGAGLCFEGLGPSSVPTGFWMNGKCTCPVCGFPDLGRGPTESWTPTYEICPSCGFEFGYSDAIEKETYENYREKWIAAGCKWRFRRPPDGWDPVRPLRNIGISL